MGTVAALMMHAAPGATVGSLLSSVISGAAPAAAGYASKILIDELARGTTAAEGKATLFAVIAAALGGVAVAAGYIGGYLSGRVQQAVICLAQQRLYGRVTEFVGVGRLEDPHFHDTMRVAERAVESAPSDVTVFIVGSARQVAALGAFVGILFHIWPPMAALVVLAAIPALLAQVVLSRASAVAARDVEVAWRNRHYYRELLMDPVAAKELRLFSIGALVHGRMMAALRRSFSIELLQNRRATNREVAFGALNAIVSALGAIVVVRGVAAGRVTVGDASLFLVAVTAIQAALSSIIPQFGRAHTSLHLFASYLDVLEEPDEPPDGQRGVSDLCNEIVIDDIWFRYDDTGPWVLRGVTFTLRAGSSIGLVGVNGSGKSTLVKLLLRLYAPTRGRITWDGVDIASIRAEELRRRIRATFQDFVTYDLPAYENVGFGDVEHLDDRARITEAASLAKLDDVLSHLPGGYDTLLSRVFSDADGAYATTLSGGQWQRMAIARAVMRQDASLLIFDEPSSGLDPEAEQEVHKNVLLSRPGTKLLISHRLNAIRECEQILVLEGGVIVESGTHGELIDADGAYARMFRLQASGYNDTAVLGRS